MDVMDDLEMSDYLRYLGGTAGAVTLGAIATTAAVYMATRPTPVETAIDLDDQAEQVPNTPSARKSRFCKNGQLCEYAFDDARTFYHAFLRGSRVSENGPCLGWRPNGKSPYIWISYDDVIQKAEIVGSGFIKKGLKPGNNTKVGIYSQNRVEYIVTELACYTYSMVIVPLYDTLGPDACTYIINQASIELVVCDKNTRVAALLKHKSATPNLKVIACVETPSDDNIKAAHKLGLDLVSFQQLESLGTDDHVIPNPCTPDDLCTVCYTSGTTGTPKGAMLTHRNLLSVVGSIHIQLENIDVKTTDVMVSYLPLAHMYERVSECYMYMNGSRVGFYQGDVRLLMDDIGVLKPTVFPTVPRLLNRMYDKVTATVSGSAIKRFLFDTAMAMKMKEIQSGVIRNNSIWDKLVFKKVQKSLGGRCRLITTGSAPISPRILNFVRAATGCAVIEGYGQTEGAAVSTLQVQGEHGTGQVGCPLPCNMIKVVDVPEMDYFAEDMQGEICIKGANVFLGYLDNPTKTREVLDKDGWLHTGDIGEWLPNGTLKIVDRKKNIFKLAQGEYIAPEKIENIYIRCPAISQMFVHGDSLKASLVGVCVPDPDTFSRWVASKLDASLVEGKTLAELCVMKEVKAAVHADLLAIGKNGGLQSFEQVRDICLHGEQFTIENGLLTPTFKSKRQEIQKCFANRIEDMYRHLQ